MNPASTLVRIATEVNVHSARGIRLTDGLSSNSKLIINGQHYDDRALWEWRWILLPDSIASNPSEIEVLSAIAQLKSQVDVVYLALSKTTLETDQYDDPLDMFLHVLGTQMLYIPWRHTQEEFSKSRIQVLKFCEQHLGVVESKVPLDSIQNILDALNDLDELSADNDFPIELQMFLIDQIAVCRRALLNYKIVGAKALVEAGYLLVASASVVEKKSEVPAEVKSKLQIIWHCIEEAISKAGVVKAGIDTLQSVLKALGS